MFQDQVFKKYIYIYIFFDFKKNHISEKYFRPAQKGFRPPSAMKGFGYFQNLRKFLENFWIFWGNFLGFFRRIFLEEFIWRNFLGDFFWEELLGSN